MNKQGTIVRWDAERGFGFVRSPGATADVFFHIRDFPGGSAAPAEGLEVRFEEIHVGGKGPRAMAVSPLEYVDPRRPPPREASRRRDGSRRPPPPPHVAAEMRAMGVLHALYTEVGRDGMLSGVAAEMTAALAQITGLQVMASGGVKDMKDIHELLLYAPRGVAGVIVGRSLYEGTLDLADALAAAAAAA